MDDNLLILRDGSRGRSGFYEYLYAVFNMPSDKGFIGVTSRVIPFFEEYAKQMSSQLMADGVEELKTYAAMEAKSEPGVVLDFLNMQYTGFFLLGADIPSSASVMLTPGGLTRQEPWEKVMAFYHIRKYKKPAYIKEPEDSIAVELHFMHQLCGLGIRVIEDGQPEKLEDIFDEQRRFINDFMLPWIPAFCDRVIAKPTEEGLTLYRGAAMFLKGFLEEEKKLLDYLPV